MFRWLFGYKVWVTLATPQGAFMRLHYFRHEPRVGDNLAIDDVESINRIAYRIIAPGSIGVVIETKTQDCSKLVANGWSPPPNKVA